MHTFTMKWLLLGLAALAAMPAQAAVKYQFTAAAEGEFPFTPQFTYISPTFVSGTATTTIQNAALTGCSVPQAPLPTTCSYVEFPPNFFNQNKDAIFVHTTNQFGAGTAAYSFVRGAFGDYGTYLDTLSQSGGPLVQATLVVSFVDSGPGGVPEPASWAMMIGGFGAIGLGSRHAQRARQRAFACPEAESPLTAQPRSLNASS